MAQNLTNEQLDAFKVAKAKFNKAKLAFKVADKAYNAAIESHAITAGRLRGIAMVADYIREFGLRDVDHSYLRDDQKDIVIPKEVFARLESQRKLVQSELEARDAKHIAIKKSYDDMSVVKTALNEAEMLYNIAKYPV